MTITALKPITVPPGERITPETIGERVQRLQAEAKALAREHIKSLEAALLEASRLAAEVAAGGEAYHVGVRELAERLGPDLDAQRQTIEALTTRRQQ